MRQLALVNLRYAPAGDGLILEIREQLHDRGAR